MQQYFLIIFYRQSQVMTMPNSPSQSHEYSKDPKSGIGIPHYHRSWRVGSVPLHPKARREVLGMVTSHG